ncbi:MAG: right-handed parallel beta-helix repeat-containing protein [Steroidobacteraceae bacterium]|nr:right-handed parallel beta-helix repeat-containing protein [Steroidobacteraceae bacterium]
MYASATVATASLLALASSTGDSTGSVLHVTNYGVDSASCGSASQPCRSISRAIANAETGATILVGPGFYGDLNRDNDFSDPGDEAVDPTERNCAVCIDKSVRALSAFGASATRIETRTNLGAEAVPGLDTLVAIEADGVTFGTPGHGFTLISPSFVQLGVRGRAGVRVGGNIAQQLLPPDRRDLEISANFGIVISRGSEVRLTGNVALDNHFGISLQNDVRAVLVGNVARDNSWEGFTITSGRNVRLIGNVASGNGEDLRNPAPDPVTGEPIFPTAAGFNITDGNLQAEDNVAIGNFGPGFRVAGTTDGQGTVRFRNNAATGNGGAGFHLVASARGEQVLVRRNNIFGNLGGDSGCGLINQSGERVDARNNFWGAPTGPGEDPADAAGPDSGCDRGVGSETQVTPFATAPVAVIPTSTLQMDAAGLASSAR